MPDTPCRLLGEIRYPDDYAFERVGEIETEVGGLLEEALMGLAVAHLEVLPGPDALRFEVWCEACSSEEGATVCETLAPLLDDGPLYRLVILREADAPITVFYLSGENLEEVTVEQP